MHANRLSYFLVLLFSSAAAAQPQIIHFKQLQQFLPQGDYETYTCGKPTGETASMMGFSTSWAQVIYRYSTDSISSTISVKITDMLNIPSYMSVSGDVDKETETGYEKTVLYKNIKVLETFDSTSQEAKLQLPFADRFLIEITGNNIPGTKSLYGLLDKTNLEGLDKSIPPAGSQKK
ncbi:MAG: hypothetical protein M1470_13145 [Bacteroidetes bacterium]|nr:hypothetical protein [Bacteroidota bacterium]MCL5739097.1 hypothetical protein [Bacteroidota bacterium]